MQSRELYDVRESKQQERDSKMQPLIRGTVLWLVIASLSAISVALLLIQGASHLNTWPGLLGAAIDRMNPFVSGIWTFVIVLAIGAICVFGCELRRRAFGDSEHRYESN